MDSDGQQNGTDIMSKSNVSEIRSIRRSSTQPVLRQRGNFLMEVKNIKFRDKDQWCESDICNLCERKYNLMFVKQHHCRLCGESICKECSQKKINEQKVCDFCFLKCSDHKQAQRRKNDLHNMIEQIEGLKAAKNNYNLSIIDINKQIFDNQEMQKEELKQFALEEGELQNEEKILSMRIEQLKENNDQFKIQSKKLEIESTQNKTNSTELKIQINKLNIDIGSVKNSIEMKEKEILNIKQLLKNVQNSESFQDLSIIRSQNDLCQNQGNNIHSTIYLGNQMDSIVERVYEEDD